MLIINSPLEQFFILPIYRFYSYFYLTNIFINIFIVLFFLIIYLLSINKEKQQHIFVIPSKWQVILEMIYANTTSVLKDNLQYEYNNLYFPIVFTTFFLILNFNIFGLLPYTFTITSELIMVFALSLTIFFGFNLIAFQIHKMKIFSLFLPSGVPILLSLLLVPIELISFFFKPISLTLRLFANMMAGHTFLKILAGFVWYIINFLGIFSIIQYLPVFVIVIFFFLELGVAVIQAFVFAILFSIYLNDIYNLH